MEGGSSDDDRLRSRRLADLYGDEPEEGEFVPGYHSDADTDEYYNNLRACSSDSEGTISDSVPANNGGTSTSSSATAINNGGGGGGASSVAAAGAVLACPFCGKEFRNHKAVCGHMKVHREQGIGKDKKGKVHREETSGKDKKGIKRNVAVVGGWGVTAKRGCSGTKRWAGFPIAESDQSMAVAVAEANMVVLEPMPLASATPNPPPMSTASATPNLSSVAVEPAAMANDSVESSNGAMKEGAAGAASPPTEAVVHPHAAPPPPAAAAGEQAPPVHQQPVPPPPPAAGRQNPNGYTCEKCNRWFRTHQGLGGHVVGHKNRELAAARQGGAFPDHRVAKPVKPHVCKVCGAEFSGGIQLGGHMRKHWSGAPLNKKRCRVAPPAGTATAGVAGLSVEPDEASPAPQPAVVGRVLLFGIDIGTAVKTPAEQEGSSATEASASRTTGGEQ